MRGAPQVGFSATMRRINSRNSLLTHFLPTGVRCRESRASPKLHPAEKLNRRLDILTVKSRLDRPTRASWKAMKTQADGILARHRFALARYKHLRSHEPSAFLLLQGLKQVQAPVRLQHHTETDLLKRKPGWRHLFLNAIKMLGKPLQDHASASANFGTSITPSRMIARKKRACLSSAKSMSCNI